MHLTHFKAVVDTEAARHRTRGEAAVGTANRRPRATEPRLADHDIRAMRGRCADHDACAEHGLRTCPLRLTCRCSACARCGAHARAVAARTRAESTSRLGGGLGLCPIHPRTSTSGGQE